MTEETTDVLVIGAGPGGYAAAFQTASRGLATTLVDLSPEPGGVCLQRGCIPSKALLHAARVVSEAKAAAHMGVVFAPPEIDLERLRSWKDAVVGRLTGGLLEQCRRRQVRFIQGEARLLSATRAEVTAPSGERVEIGFHHAVLACGSRPSGIPGLDLGSPRIWDSTAALALTEIPRTLLIVGGGIIGLELGTVYATLGSRVTVVEMTPTLVPGADGDLVRFLRKRLDGLFAGIQLETRVTALTEEGEGLRVISVDKEGKEESRLFDRVLVATGRLPNSANLGLERTRVVVGPRGFVEVDASRLTAEPTIFAIGDLVGQPMLAHKASHEAKVVAEVLGGGKSRFEPAAIPGVAYTDPEIAWTGLTETEARKQGVEVKVVRFPWGACGRAHTMERSEGMTKLILDPGSGRVLGVGIVGVGAGDLIAEGTLAIEMAALAGDLADTIHPHPTLSETLMEAAELFQGHCVHYFSPPRRG
ncbi:MAG: dihydrolipoyl dehydrogenase [Magnetococcales bacterium]|nr:dihydrolipoyl dehydrogenase [Magnetococcales bacterium]